MSAARAAIRSFNKSSLRCNSISRWLRCLISNEITPVVRVSFSSLMRAEFRKCCYLLGAVGMKFWTSHRSSCGSPMDSARIWRPFGLISM